jgi:lactocepin
MDSVYETLDDFGTNVCCSAGNNYSSSYSSKNGDYALTSNPDNGVVGSSSSYTRNLSVASINANATSFFNVGGTSVAYNDISGHDFAFEMSEGNHNYVMVPGAGNLSDYTGIDVSGKIAVVMRGTLTFTLKALNAAQMGAKACIIYNNRDGELLNMSITEYKIPVIAIAMPDGVMMGKQNTKTITIDSTISGVVTMSGFSSWGPLPSLELKPEITAPGGDIYSSLPGTDADGNYNYGMMSGTSMSAPYMTGVAAIVKQYLEKVYPDYTNDQLELLTNRLCMSTASIAYDAAGVAYSPRKQGAGVVDIDAALAAEAYIYVAGQDKTKLELGDDKDETGIYEMTFNVSNMGSETLTYNINTIVQTESVTENGLCIAQKGHEFKDADTSYIQVSGGGTLNGETLTLNPGGDASVTVKVVLTDADKAYMKDNFKNGIYVEGFVCLESTDGKVDLSVPYLAFFGDWTKAPILDQDAFSETNATMAASDVYACYGEDLYYAGDYMFDMPDGYTMPARAKDKIAVSFGMGDGISSIYYVPLGQLRGAKTVDVSVTDAVTGQEYFSKTDINVRKTYYDSSSGMVQSFVGDILPDLYLDVF